MSFLFLGPSGVGKALAEFFFDDEQPLTRLDMGEFMERHLAQRLIGAPLNTATIGSPEAVEIAEGRDRPLPPERSGAKRRPFLEFLPATQAALAKSET
jgi:hypothetical protein